MSTLVRNLLRIKDGRSASAHSINCDRVLKNEFLAQDSFLSVLCLERKRTERSGRPFALMLLKCGHSADINGGEGVLPQIAFALWRSTRETDIKGRYENGSVIGVILTELPRSDPRSVENVILTRIKDALSNALTDEQRLRQITISFYVFPEDLDTLQGRSRDFTLYPDLEKETRARRASRLAKRIMDIAGSLFALILFSPLLILISLAVKLTSKGPLVFKQERLGQYGRSFTFLKFRSMYSTADHKLHEEYVKLFISGKASSNPADEGDTSIYKLTRDPRVTPVGTFLRRTSMDELPQLLNVLRGDMSLVGPRPSVSYELASYDIWHRRRLLEAKPGMTGLWQVTGRCRIQFNDMVRLDLKYAKSQSLWLDTKILLQTPQAVISGEGAY